MPAPKCEVKVEVCVKEKEKLQSLTYLRMCTSVSELGLQPDRGGIQETAHYFASPKAFSL